MASAAGNDVAEKAVEDIRENLRRIASAILEAQRRRKSYRAGGENRPAAGSRSYSHVGPKPGSRIRASKPGGDGGHALPGGLVGVGEPVRGRQNDRMFGRADGRIRPVDLEACGAMAENEGTAGAEHRFVDARKNPRPSRMARGIGFSIRRAAIEALSAKTDAEARLRRATRHAPEPAAFAREREAVFARFPLPSAGAAIAADLDSLRLVFGNRGHPVETIATDVKKSAPLVQPCISRIQHARGPVFGMRAGKDRPIWGEQARSLRVKQVVGNDVDFVTLGIEPMDEMKVRRELMRSVKCSAARSRTEVHDGPSAATVTDPAAVGMKVVGAL